MTKKPEQPRFALNKELATQWLARCVTAYDSLNGEPFPGREDGYVTGNCGHAVARSEWEAGFEECERCPATSFWADVAMADIGNGFGRGEDTAQDAMWLIQAAQDAEVITDTRSPVKPEYGLVFESSEDYEDGTYRWLVGATKDGSLFLTGPPAPLALLGSADKSGLPAALDVLREAVEQGNALYDAATTWAAVR